MRTPRFRGDAPLTQLPPTRRGIRAVGANPLELFAFHGWAVWCFGVRCGVAVGASASAESAAVAFAASAAS